jgi:pilus assembly protein CpaD
MVIRLFLMLAALLALAACESKPDLPPADMAKSINVQHVRVQYAAAFAPGVSDLSASEVTRLNTFLDQADMLPGDKVFLAAPAGDPLATARTGRIVSLLARHGLGAEPVPLPPGGVEPNHVVVLVDRYVAVPPACPDWSEDPTGTHDNVTGSNYGCATLNDLAQMIANPHDLVTGEQMGPAEGDPAADSVLRYRTGTVLPFSGSSASGTTSGSSSSSTSSGMTTSSAPSAASSSSPSQ